MSRVIKIVLGATLISQVAMAQAPSGGSPPATSPSTNVTVAQPAGLSPQDMLTQSQTYKTNTMQTTQRLSQMVEEARKQKDVIRLTCLTDKVVQANANMNILDKALISLQDAVGRNDEGSSTHEFTRITIVNQKVQILGAEAEGCVGEELQFVGATKVDVEVSKDVRNDDTSQPATSGTGFERPPVASPFM
jgi:hypothetical protein